MIRPRIERALLASVAALLAFMATSCVTVVEDEEDGRLSKTTLFVTRAGSEVTLAWQTEPDKVYTVFFADRRETGARWEVLPGALNMVGTGEMIHITEKVPEDQQRYYRLQIGPIDSTNPSP